MKLYLAGPMRGIPQFNFPAFFKAAEYLRSLGHEVFNPAERDYNVHGAEIMNSARGNLDDIKHTGFSHREALAEDMSWIARHAEGIVLLPGWHWSKGAKAEKALAEALGLEVFYIVREELVAELGQLVDYPV